MDKATLTALKQSIEKWEKRAAGDRSLPLGVDNCPLCQLFHPYCSRGCPVAGKTGQSTCNGTPYHTYINDRTDKNAKAELEFLKSLLPPEEKEEKKDFKWADLDYLG